MVHSTFAQGHVMGGRDSSPLGIPKSPSFHSGLDLVASASVDSLVAAQTTSVKQLEHDFGIIGGGRAEGNGRIFGKRNNTEAVKVLQETGYLPKIQG